jgi:arginine-tRNA-protein transferase
MLAQAHAPEQLSPGELDAYLAKGWFRMGQTIFTTNFVRFQQEIYSTIWLRILLDQYQPDPTQIKLFKRNANFRTSIQQAAITEEKEELYLRYQQSLAFPTSESLRHLLLNESDTPSIYNTHEVTVHDGDRLIAIGFFDIGGVSAEGIVSVYDPAYKKYSLGKFLIYQKMQYCQRLKLRYFYPGYFVPGNPFFDYKLSIGRPVLQFLQLSTQHWLGIEVFTTESTPRLMMQKKLASLQKSLAQSGVDSNVVNYEYFDANLVPDLREAELFDFPVFLFCENKAQDMLPLIVFDVRDARYHLRMCIPFWQPGEINPDPAFYSSYVLKTLYDIHASAEVDEMKAVFLKSVTSK